MGDPDPQGIFPLDSHMVIRLFHLSYWYCQNSIDESILFSKTRNNYKIPLPLLPTKNLVTYLTSQWVKEKVTCFYVLFLQARRLKI